ncbi:MAG: hypothetical protein ACWGQW_07845 [bacterium]
MDQESYEREQRLKERIREKNVDAIAQILVDLQNRVNDLSAEVVDLRRIVTNTHGDMASIRGEFNALRAMGYIKMGTGPTEV